MKINNFDHAQAQNMQREIDNALQFLAAKYGVSIKIKGNSKYDARELTIGWIECHVLNDAGKVETTEALNFKQYASHYGLKPDHLGIVVIDNGRKFKVVGLNMRAPKSPIQMERLPDGRSFKAPVGWLKSRLPGGALAGVR